MKTKIKTQNKNKNNHTRPLLTHHFGSHLNKFNFCLYFFLRDLQWRSTDMDYQNPLARDLFVAQVKFLETQLEKTQNFLTINHLKFEIEYNKF